MARTVLGVSAFYHDSAAALVVDGEIVAAAQEERFSRQKHDPRFPSNAVKYCLAEAGLTVADVDLLVFYEDPMEKFDRILETYLAFAPSGYDSFAAGFPLWARQKLDLPRELENAMGPGFRGEILFADHHESHAASAFFPSPFEEAAILTLDAVGEWTTSSYGIGSGNRITLLNDMRFPHSLGMLYSAFTYYAGFKVNSGEYKLMGLAGPLHRRWRHFQRRPRRGARPCRKGQHPDHLYPHGDRWFSWRPPPLARDAGDARNGIRQLRRPRGGPSHCGGRPL